MEGVLLLQGPPRSFDCTETLFDLGSNETLKERLKSILKQCRCSTVSLQVGGKKKQRLVSRHNESEGWKIKMKIRKKISYSRLSTILYFMYNKCLFKRTFSDVSYLQYCLLHMPPPLPHYCEYKTLDDGFRNKQVFSIYIIQ